MDNLLNIINKKCMREIKFRVWDKADKNWKNLSMCELGEIIMEPDRYSVELMQYTGLKDKQGKEIYFDDYVEDEVGQIWLVKWNKTTISLLNISTGDIMSMRNNLTIKSNLYENTFEFTPKYTEIS